MVLGGKTGWASKGFMFCKEHRLNVFTDEYLLLTLLVYFTVPNLVKLLQRNRSNSSIYLLKFRNDTFSLTIPTSAFLDKLLETFFCDSMFRLGGIVTNWLGILMMS